jgi:uncharacterized membrane protein
MTPKTLRYIAYSVILTIMILSLYPLVSDYFYTPKFSEIAIMGPNENIGEYVHQVPLGAEYSVRFYIGNHETETKLYKTVVKLVDNSTLLESSPPFEVEALTSYLTVVRDGENSTFSINPMINQEFNGKLVAELYVFDPSSDSYVYHDRWVAIWLRTEN